MPVDLNYLWCGQMSLYHFLDCSTIAGGNRIGGQGYAAWSLAITASVSSRHQAIVSCGPQFHEEFRGH